MYLIKCQFFVAFITKGNEVDNSIIMLDLQQHGNFFMTILILSTVLNNLFHRGSMTPIKI